MKIELIKHEDEVIGWDILPESIEDRYILNQMRNMEYFGLGDDSIEYAGRKSETLHVNGRDIHFVSVLRYRTKEWNT